MMSIQKRCKNICHVCFVKIQISPNPKKSKSEPSSSGSNQTVTTVFAQMFAWTIVCYNKSDLYFTTGYEKDCPLCKKIGKLDEWR